MTIPSFFKDVENMPVAFLEAKSRGMLLDIYPQHTLPNLDDKAAVAKHLVEGHYIPLLQSLHAKKSPERLSWLETHADMHAPLIYELGIEHFKAKPSEKTFLISSVLIKAATFRAKQDSQCCLDPDIANGGVADQMNGIYESQLDKLRRKAKIPSLSLGNKTINSVVVAGVFDATLQSARKELPPPTWIGLSNTKTAWYDHKTPPGEAYMYPSTTHKEIRDEYAKSVSTAIANSISTIKSPSSSRPPQE
jgi:hypothetical protein